MIISEESVAVFSMIFLVLFAAIFIWFCISGVKNHLKPVWGTAGVIGMLITLGLVFLPYIDEVSKISEVEDIVEVETIQEYLEGYQFTYIFEDETKRCYLDLDKKGFDKPNDMPIIHFSNTIRNSDTNKTYIKINTKINTVIPKLVYGKTQSIKVYLKPEAYDSLIENHVVYTK